MQSTLLQRASLATRFALLFCLATAGVLPAAATAATIRCDGCSDATMKYKAKMADVGEHTLYDLAGNRVKAYYVSYEPELYPNATNYYGRLHVMQLGVPADVKEYVSYLSTAYAETGGTFRAKARVDAHDLGVNGLGSATAYDVMGDANLRARIGDRLAQGSIPNVPVWAEWMAAHLQSYLNFRETLIMEIEIELWDGSLVVYEVKYGRNSASYLEGRSRTAGGQLIPEDNTRNYAGTWYGAGDDMNAFINWMERLGAGTSSSGSGMIIQSVSCSWNGHTLHCVIKYSAF